MRINKSLIAYTPTSGAGSGSVTSVALSAPTGFTVSGSPITTSGTLSIAFTTGYGIPPLMTGNSGKFLTTNGTTMSWVNIAGTDVTGAALTEVDDTNVTMTLGGTPSTALLRSVSMTLGWAGQLAVSRGGTGAATLTGVIIGNGTSAMTAITGGPNQILRRNAGNTAYEFWTANYMTNPMTLEGSIIYATTGGTPTELFANSTSTRKYLSQINGGAPTWEAINAISGSGTTNYLPKWTSSTALGNSVLLENAGSLFVGGSTAPDAGDVGLQIYGNTYSSLFLRSTSVIGLIRSHNPDLKLYIGTLTNHQLSLIVNGTERMFINTSGNVGIGGTANNKLDVYGSIGISGVAFAYKSGNYHVFADAQGDPAVQLGNATNAINYYDNTFHGFRSRGGTTAFSTISSAGIVVNNGSIQIPSTFNLTWGGSYGVNIPTISGTSGTGAFINFYPSGSSSGEKMRLSDSGQLRLNGYTSTTSFTGIAQGYLAFTSGGNIITTATPGGVSGTQNYLAKFDSTGLAVGNSRIVDDGANFLFNGASSVVTGLNLVGSISATDSGGGVTILRRSEVPASGDSLGIIDAWGITTGSTYVWGGGIEIRASQAWNSTSAGTEIAIATTPDNTTTATDMFVFLNNGAVRFIGRTSNPIGAAAGTMYYNSSANNMRYYNGTSWITF